MKGTIAKIICVSAMIFVLTLCSPVYADPESTNYKLRDYGFGSGGTDEDGSSSTNYRLYGLSGEQDAGKAGSTNYKVGGGLNFTQQAHVPPAPTFSNPGSAYYNQLEVILENGGNASDTLFALQISDDGFGSNFNYVQDDHTIGSTLGPEDWQTYTDWGGALGFMVVGLASGTTYQIRVAAMQGDFTQTGYGPSDVASTVDPSITFDIDVASTNTESSPPYIVDLGFLDAGTISVAADKIWIDLSTNATGGGMVYVSGENGGLYSQLTNYTINSVSSDLVSLSEGFGLRGSSVSESTGGPFIINAPYDGSGNNVGLTASTPQLIFDSSNQPVGFGRGSIEVQAKASNLTKAGSDYSEVVTIIATAGF